MRFIVQMADSAFQLVRKDRETENHMNIWKLEGKNLWS